MKMIAFGQAFLSARRTAGRSKIQTEGDIRRTKKFGQGDSSLTLFPPRAHGKALVAMEHITRKESRAPGGKARPDADVNKLEAEPQRELDMAWKIVLAGYSTKTYYRNAAIRRTELRVVEPVEELGAELDAEPFLRTKFRVLKDGKVKVLHTVSAYVRLGTRIGAIAAIVRMRKHGSVKPVGQP